MTTRKKKSDFKNAAVLNADGTVTLTLSITNAAKLAHLTGMSSDDDGVFETLSALFAKDRTWKDGAYAKHAKRYGFHEPFVNHAGVIVFNEPGMHGPHNRPHFPCATRGEAMNEPDNSGEHEHCEHFNDWPPPELFACQKCGEEYGAGEENNGRSPCCMKEGDPIGRAEPGGDPGDGLGAQGVCCECGAEQEG